MHGDGRRRGDREGEHEIKKKNIAAVHTWYCDIKGHEEYEVEQILGERTFGRWKKKQFLVKWKGYSTTHNSWEPEENVTAPELVKDYRASRSAQARTSLLKPERHTLCPPMTTRPSSPT